MSQEGGENELARSEGERKGGGKVNNEVGKRR